MYSPDQYGLLPIIRRIRRPMISDEPKPSAAPPALPPAKPAPATAAAPPLSPKEPATTISNLQSPISNSPSPSSDLPAPKDCHSPFTAHHSPSLLNEAPEPAPPSAISDRHSPLTAHHSPSLLNEAPGTTNLQPPLPAPTTAANPSESDRYAVAARLAGCPSDQMSNFFDAGIVLQPKQLAASAAARLCDRPDGPKAVGYGGARGGGKSFWLLAQIGADDCQRVPGLKCLLLRKVGKSNVEHFEDLRQRVFRHLPHEFNASRGWLTFPNGSRIVLGHYQSEKDIDVYLGLEYDVIGIEEATQLTLRKYEDISTCCRSSKTHTPASDLRPPPSSPIPHPSSLSSQPSSHSSIHWRPRIYSTTNPGGIGHQWYLEKFIAPHQARTESDTRFIPARVDDNAFLNPEYKSNLASRTGWQYHAWYLGQWNFSAGQYFRNFRPDVHLLGDNFRPPSGSEWFAAMDYGYTHLTVALLACQDQEENIYVLDEHAERYWIPQRHAQAIKAMLARHRIFSSQDHLRENLRAQYPDPCTERERLWRQLQSRMLARFVAGADMFASESTGASVAQQYRDLGLKLRAASMDRVAGWSAILQRLGDPDAGIKPTLFIHKRCRHLLECLPYLQHDPDRPGDVLKTNINEDGVGGDDPADALRYLVATKPREIFVRKLTGL